MRVSGHETFSIREGWLHKGLKLLVEEPDKLFHKFAADYLGVGSAMAKSIRHWLRATGLAEADPENRGQSIVTEFGKLIYKYDPFFIETDTWWLLHINLIGKTIYADSWYWFFNIFNLERFERSVVVENLRQYLQIRFSRKPSVRTLERDVNCLLASYSRNIPAESTDPEESRDCPFRDLELMSHFRSSGSHKLNHKAKTIHPAVFGYCISRTYEDAGQGDISIQRLITEPGGPGRAFVLTNESLYETLVGVIDMTDEINIAGYAGQRAVSVPKRSSHEWIMGLYTQKRNK